MSTVLASMYVVWNWFWSHKMKYRGVIINKHIFSWSNKCFWILLNPLKGNKPSYEPISTQIYMSPYGITRPQWVNLWKEDMVIYCLSVCAKHSWPCWWPCTLMFRKVKISFAGAPHHLIETVFSELHPLQCKKYCKSLYAMMMIYF